MMPKRAMWHADIQQLLKAEQLWLSGRYNDPECAELTIPEDFPVSFLTDFTFSEPEIQPLFRITDSQGKLILHESFINYLQRFKCNLEIAGTGKAESPTVMVCGPALQLELLKLVLPDE
jgi:hypothetical protein